jgi:hypothetical protein
VTGHPEFGTATSDANLIDGEAEILSASSTSTSGIVRQPGSRRLRGLEPRVDRREVVAGEGMAEEELWREPWGCARRLGLFRAAFLGWLTRAPQGGEHVERLAAH